MLQEERLDFLKTYRALLQNAGESLLPGDTRKVKQYIHAAVDKNSYGTDIYGLNILNRNIHTALIVAQEIGLKRASLLAVMLYPLVLEKQCDPKEIEKKFGVETLTLIQGLVKTHELYAKNAVIESDNFRDLLLSFAEDVRVILIMIAERLYLMRMAKVIDNEEYRMQIAAEASYLY
ncbi:MAG: HD domain-containing protein, partial [Dysgonamonadaceae bacterium]|nr:HD domain-containing protein [Dysgonamonadaceae bacterium]